MLYSLIHSRNYTNFLWLFIISCVYALVFGRLEKSWPDAFMLLFSNYIISILFYLITDNYKVLKTSTFAPFYLFLGLLWWADFIALDYWNKPVIISIIFMLYKGLSLAKHTPYYFTITDMGLITGVWRCFDVHLSAYLLPVYWAILSFKEFKWRNIIIPMLGFCIPVLYYGSFLYLQDRWNDNIVPRFFERETFDFSLFYSPAFLWFYTLLIAGLPAFARELQANIVTKRKGLNFFVITGITGILIFYFTQNVSLMISLLAPSVSIVLSPSTYSYKKKWISLSIIIFTLLLPLIWSLFYH